MKIILNEGTKYDNQAVDMLVKAGVSDTQLAKQFIEDVRKGGVHAFVHSDPWLLKYLKGIARMVIKDYNQNKPEDDVYDPYEWLNKNKQTLDSYLTWVKENREKIGSSVMDDKFLNKMSIEDVEKELKQIEEERERKSKEELANKKFEEQSNFDLDMINSFDEFNSKYGGRATGDGTSDKWAGAGGTAWCHANDKYTYNNWVDGNNYVFFVLYNKNWKDIPFGGTPDPNKRSYASGENPNPKDAYGNSLIALLVNRRNGKLEKATLRCNHVGVPRNPDNQYNTYAELSEVAGFNVEEEVYKLLSLDKPLTLRKKPLFGDVFFPTYIPDTLAENIPLIDNDWWVFARDTIMNPEYIFEEATGDVVPCNPEKEYVAYRPFIYFDLGSYDTEIGQKFSHIGYTWTVIRNEKGSNEEGIAVCDDYVTKGKYDPATFRSIKTTLSRKSSYASEKKYTLLEDDTTVVTGKILKRIMNTNTGEVGGYIESFDNLSQEGECWVDFNSIVMDSALVADDSEVSSNSYITDNAIIGGSAKIVDSMICGRAIISDNAQITGSYISGESQIFGSAQIHLAKIRGATMVGSNAQIKGSSEYPIEIEGENWINGDAQINGHVQINKQDNSERTVIDGETKINGAYHGIMINGSRIQRDSQIEGNATINGCTIKHSIISTAFSDTSISNSELINSEIYYMYDMKGCSIEGCRLSSNIPLSGCWIEYNGSIDLTAPDGIAPYLKLENKEILSDDQLEQVITEIDNMVDNFDSSLYSKEEEEEMFNESYKKKGNRRSERSIQRQYWK